MLNDSAHGRAVGTHPGWLAIDLDFVPPLRTMRRGLASFATVPDSGIPNPHGQPHGDPVGDFAGQVATVECPRAFNCWASVSSAEKCEATTAESSMARFAFINL